MIKERTSTGYLFGIWLSALALSLVTYLQPGTHLEFIGGIDHSWAYGLNVAFDKRWLMGRDIIFTFGPLGFLEHTRVVSLDLLYISSLFSWLVSIAMNVALLHLACVSTTHRRLRVINILVAVALVAFSFPHIQRLLILGYVALVLHWLSGRWFYLVLFSLTAALCVLIKFSYGAASVALLAGYLLIHGWRKKDIRSLWVGSAALIFSYLAIWWLIYGSLESSFDYLKAELYISRGNASAMALNPENNWSAIVLFYVCIVAIAWIVQKKSAGLLAWLPAAFVLPLLVWTKYTFSQQEEFHQVPILAFVIFITGIFVIAMQTLSGKVQLGLLLVVAWFAWVDMHTESVGAPDYQNVPHWTVRKPEIMQYDFKLKRLFNIWRTAEKERLQPLVLPETLRKTIGNASVDVYPWELTIASVNELNWKPRPAFQIYISYLPFLDQKNADFFNDDSRAPRYLIWHHHFYQDIMNRYSLSSEPLTVASILNHYRMMDCQGYFCLWQRVEKPQLLDVAVSETQSVRWNEWIPVPPIDHDVLRARLHADRTLAGHINLMAWKEGGIEIDYQLNDGNIKTHDLLIDNAVSGVWVSPYVESYLGSSGRVKELADTMAKKILGRIASRGNMEAVEPALTGYRVRGWMAGEAADEESYILLSSASKHFLFPVARINRPDVADHFARLGQQVSPLCGIDQEIDVQELPVGTYRVRFVARSGGDWSALPEQGFVVNVDAKVRDRHKVKQFRIRTTRPWAFEEGIQLEWEPLRFRDTPPWR